MTFTRMSANAQRDGRPAEYRWHRLYNTTRVPCINAGCQDAKHVEITWGAPNSPTDLSH